MNWRDNRIIPASNIRQDDPTMNAKTYTMTTACADSLGTAISALGIALNIAESSSLPVEKRLVEVILEVEAIRRDAEALRKQSVEQPQRMLTVDEANATTKLSRFERAVYDKVIEAICYMPIGDEREICERLVGLNLIRRGEFRNGVVQCYHKKDA